MKMKLINNVVFLTFILTSLSFSQTVNKLLSLYNKASDLSYKTRQESLGHWIIFTRQDIRRMQAYTLKDILRAVPMFNYGPNESGNYSLTVAGFAYDYHEQFALYINDHLVNMAPVSEFSIYGDYPLKDIDHIEIYLGPASVILGNVPKLVIIKLYTKKPSRENISSLRLTANSRGGYDIAFSSAKPINRHFSYSFMFDQTYEAFPKFSIYNINHSRNAFKQYLFLNLNHKGIEHFSSWHLDVGAMKSRQNVFMGDEFYNPVGGINKNQNAYISFTDYFDKSLKIHLGFTFEHGDFTELSDNNSPLYIPKALNSDISPFYYYFNLYNYRYSGDITKTFSTRRNKLIVGSGFQFNYVGLNNTHYEGFDLSGNIVNGLIKNPDNHRNYYTVYLEDMFNINDKNLIIGDLKFDKYTYNGKSRNSNYSARIGYVMLPFKSISFKGFLYKTYTPPTIYYFINSSYPLHDVKYKGLSFETDYTYKSNKLRFLYAYIDMKDAIEPSFNYPYGYYNDPHPFYINTFWISDTYDINYNNKVEFNYFINKINKPYTSPNQGLSVGLFNEYKKFSFYNELIYKNAFDGYLGFHESPTYMWDSAVTYHISPVYSISLKAQNILNSSYKVPLIIYDSNGNPTGIYTVNAYPTTFSISLERLF